MKYASLLSIVMTATAGCSQKTDVQKALTTPVEKQAGITANPEETAKEIKKLIPASSGSPNELWMLIGQSNNPPRLADFEMGGALEMASQSLSLILFAIEADRSGLGGPAKDPTTFIIETSVPTKLAKAISKSSSEGYGTFLQPEFVKDVTCLVDKDQATGSVLFVAEGLYRGRVEYLARRVDGKWRIEEYRLPGCQLKVSLDTNGKWKLARL